MRVLMLSQFYPPIIGGAELHVQSLSIELAARGHDVAVVTIQHEGQVAFEIDHNVRVYRIRSSVQRIPRLFSSSQRQYPPPFPDPKLMLAIRRIIVDEQPQIVHAHNWLVHSFLPLKTWSGARLIVTLHDYRFVCAKVDLMYHEALCNGPSMTRCFECAIQHYGIAKGIPTILSNWIMKPIEGGAVDMFLAVSQAVASGNGLVGSRLPFQVISNFIADHTDVAQADLDSYLRQLPDKDYLLFVGSLGRAKGVDILLRAYEELADAPPLVLIGYQTPDWPLLATRCPSNVFVFKDWPHDAVMAAWRRSIIALVPSVWPDPCPTVVMEAMSTCCPVIASRLGGIVDLVTDGETGLLVQPGDPYALQQTIKQLLAHPSLRNRMGQAAQQKAIDFQASRVVPRIEQVYQAAL